MRIHSVSHIHHPLDRVYRAYRDELPEIAAFMPDVREIRVRARTDRPTGPQLFNEWHASTAIPSVAERFVTPDMLRWEDHASWVDAETHVNWNLVIPAFRDQVQCSGRNAFFADGARTRVVLSGELHIAVNTLPGMPGFMARRLGPKVEQFIVQLITPNLETVNQSLQDYLDSRS